MPPGLVKITHFDQVYMDARAAVQYNDCLIDENEKNLNGSVSGRVPTMDLHDREKRSQALARHLLAAPCRITALRAAVPPSRPA
jgi:hypothetical protein